MATCTSKGRYHISFPAIEPHQLDQDEAYFTLAGDDGRDARLRFHDYDALYQLPGLYDGVISSTPGCFCRSCS